MVHDTLKPLLLFLLLLPVTFCVRIKNFSIPDHSYVGESAQLVCDYEMTEEGEQFQGMLWMKGALGSPMKTIFMFDLRPTNTGEPMRVPGINMEDDLEQAEGIHIDMMKSNQTTIRLTNLELKSKGRFTCQVLTSHGLKTDSGCFNVTEQPEINTTTPPSISSDEKLNALEKIVAEMKERLETDPPYIFVCAYHASSFDLKEGPVTYGETTYTSTNLETGGLNISTGVFTAGHPGIYSVSWSMVNYNRGGQDFVYLYKNNGMARGSSTKKANQGRTMFVYLKKGDILSLNCHAYCDDVYGGTTFCVSLVKSHEEMKRLPRENEKWCDIE